MCLPVKFAALAPPTVGTCCARTAFFFSVLNCCESEKFVGALIGQSFRLSWPLLPQYMLSLGTIM